MMKFDFDFSLNLSRTVFLNSYIIVKHEISL